MDLKILAVGDVTGNAGLEYIKKNLRRRAAELGAELTVVNGENTAEVHGISANDAGELFSAGADVITTGNHAFGRRDIYSMLDDEQNILRPDNFPPMAPGHGSVIVSAAGMRVLVINLQGNVGMNESLFSPFAAADAILSREAGKFDAAVVDFHAEATSEKIAMGLYLNGRVSAVWGTHTHVATADERILSGGTAYITDIGMSGPSEGVLGVDADIIITRFKTAMPQRFKMAEGKVESTGVLITLGENGKAKSIKRVFI